MSDWAIFAWCVIAIVAVWGLVWISDQEDDVWWGKDDDEF